MAQELSSEMQQAVDKFKANNPHARMIMGGKLYPRDGVAPTHFLVFEDYSKQEGEYTVLQYTRDWSIIDSETVASAADIGNFLEYHVDW